MPPRILTPEGLSGDNTDPVMLLSMWTARVRAENALKKLLTAGMGKPTYPINQHTVEMYLQYWMRIQLLLESLKKPIGDAAIDYGDPRGDEDARKIMAEAMTRWYDTPIIAENILFTVGGAGALRVIYETFNERNQDKLHYRVITPFPHYTLYADNRHTLHPVDVMSEPGYRLTAKGLQKSIEEAYRLSTRDHNDPQYVLLCNPSNPLGTTISEEELYKIVAVLRKYPQLRIVIDEAYTEMCWNEQTVPALIKIAPDLKNRTILIRSATKAHSAAGERMAMLMAFDSQLMTELRNKNIGLIGHAPRSAQIAYAHTMATFGEKEKQGLKDFYKPKVDYVQKRIKEMGAAMPDTSYKVDSTFYVMADFSDLLGEDVPEDAKRALGNVSKVRTSEHLAYYLLFKDLVMLAPGQYCGLPADKGYLRITCSESAEELKELMDRLEQRLVTVRQNQCYDLRIQVATQLQQLQTLNPTKHQIYLQQFIPLMQVSEDSAALKMQNQQLKVLLSDVRVSIKKSSEEGVKQATNTVQSFFKRRRCTRAKEEFLRFRDEAWHGLVERIVLEDGALKNYLLNLGPKDRSIFLPWLDHWKTIQYPQMGIACSS